MLREFMPAIRACIVTFVMCAVVYPAVVWGFAELVFPFQAEGSLIYDADGRTVVGSATRGPAVRLQPLLPSAPVSRRLQG